MFGIDNNTVLLLHAEDFNDSSNNNIKVTNNGVTIDGNGKFGKCFNINNTQIDFPSLSALKNFHLGNYTIDFWINQTGYNGNYPTIFYLGSGAVVNRTFMLYSSSTKVRIEVGNGQNPIDFLEIPPIPLNEWVHLAIVRSENTLIAFKNGVEQGRKELTGTPYTTSNPCFLGNSDGSFIGKIDEFRISNIARWTESFKVSKKEYFNDAPSNTSLVESVEMTNMCYENLVNLKNNLKNKLKQYDVEIKPTDNMSSMIDKISNIKTVTEVDSSYFFVKESSSTGSLHLVDPSSFAIISVFASQESYSGLVKRITAYGYEMLGIGNSAIYKIDMSTGTNTKISKINMLGSDYSDNGDSDNGTRSRLYKFGSYAGSAVTSYDAESFATISTGTPSLSGAYGSGICGGFDGNKERLFVSSSRNEIRLDEIDVDTFAVINSNKSATVDGSCTCVYENGKLIIYILSQSSSIYTMTKFDPDTLLPIESSSCSCYGSICGLTRKSLQFEVDGQTYNVLKK